MTIPVHSKFGSKRFLEFLKANGIKNASDLNKLKSKSVKAGENGFYSHYGEFFVDAPVDLVWQHYTTCSPAQAWNNKHMDLVLLFDRKTERAYAPDATDFPVMDEGILIFIDVHFIYGKVQVTVGHEVDCIDHDERLIKTNYLENSKSTGSQYIRFYEEGPNRTKVVHDSYYASGSAFRDRILYPTLHSVTIAAFHNNLKRLLPR